MKIQELCCHPLQTTSQAPWRQTFCCLSQKLHRHIAKRSKVIEVVCPWNEELLNQYRPQTMSHPHKRAHVFHTAEGNTFIRKACLVRQWVKNSNVRERSWTWVHCTLSISTLQVKEAYIFIVGKMMNLPSETCTAPQWYPNFEAWGSKLLERRNSLQRE